MPISASPPLRWRLLLRLVLAGLAGLFLGAPAGPLQAQDLVESQGIRFRLISGGAYQLGSPAGEAGRYAHEAPPYAVALRPFYLAETETTNAQYARFLQATGHPAPLYWKDKKLNAPSQPVVGVTWNDAQAFARWLTRKTGVTHRLPTEAEWEAAARGGLAGQPYPWGGEAPDAGGRFRANYNPGNFAADGFATTAPVGSFPPNGYGLYDMAGNVAEWCQDQVRTPAFGGPFGRGEVRLLKGASWYSRARDLRCAARQFAPPASADGFIGFRVVRLLPGQ
ncbi:MAG: formylglycine-generating enzyme family protein [Deltaproteobacteria bacterium]|nr:formylglycine-generating enzyme family protein [Deltaproteobacteria bacterium]